MKTKHTPGPWHYVPGSEALSPWVQRGSEGGFVVYGRSREAEDADARLIAAAPDLLEALQEMVADFGPTPSDRFRSLGQACAAIAKATGDHYA